MESQSLYVCVCVHAPTVARGETQREAVVCGRGVDLFLWIMCLFCNTLTDKHVWIMHVTTMILVIRAIFSSPFKFYKDGSREMPPKGCQGERVCGCVWFAHKSNHLMIDMLKDDMLPWRRGNTKCHSFIHSLTHSLSHERRRCQCRVPSLPLSCSTLCHHCHFFSFFSTWCCNLSPSVSHSILPLTTLASYWMATSQSLLIIFYYPWTPAPPTCKAQHPLVPSLHSFLCFTGLTGCI